MDLIREERLREIVERAAPFLEGDRYPRPKSAPSDPAARDAWFEHVAERRENQHSRVLAMGGATGGARPELPGVKVEEIDIPVSGSCGWSQCGACAAGSITAIVYRPTDLAANVPALVNFHGGGWWAMGGLDLLRLAGPAHAKLAVELGLVVVDVDYRMSPEHKFPLPVEDCFTALQWTVANADTLGIDPTRLAVGGGSAGGNLSAAVALMARDRGGPALRGQILNIPVTDSNCNSESMRLFASGYMMSRQNAKDMWEMYLASPADAYDPYASPMHALDVSNLPPALVVVGDYDVLRDEGLAYAHRLLDAGIAVTVQRLPQCHGAALPENAAILERLTTDFLRANLDIG